MNRNVEQWLKISQEGKIAEPKQDKEQNSKVTNEEGILLPPSPVAPPLPAAPPPQEATQNQKLKLRSEISQLHITEHEDKVRGTDIESTKISMEQGGQIRKYMEEHDIETLKDKWDMQRTAEANKLVNIADTVGAMWGDYQGRQQRFAYWKNDGSPKTEWDSGHLSEEEAK